MLLLIGSYVGDGPVEQVSDVPAITEYFFAHDLFNNRTSEEKPRISCRSMQRAWPDIDKAAKRFGLLLFLNKLALCPANMHRVSVLRSK